VSQATTQAMDPFEDTNATFDPRMPVATFHEPSFVFVLQTGFGTIATFRKDHVFYTRS